jgi:hypothetical protein
VVFTEAGKPDDAIVRIDGRPHMRVVCARPNRFAHAGRDPAYAPLLLQPAVG